MNKKIAFFLLNESFFRELENDSEVRTINKNRVFQSGAANFLFKLCFSLKVNSIFPVPFKRFWFKRLFEKAYHPGAKNIFIFYEWWYDSDFMRWLKRKHGDVVSVLYLDDTIGQFRKTLKTLSVEKIRKEFDYIFSYNVEDVEKYGFQYTSAFFSKYDQRELPRKEKSDICFVGLVKERGELISRIFDKLKGTCDCNFIVCKSEKDFSFPSGIKVIDKTMSYAEYLSNEINSNCILEILKGDTASPTFRCWEAVYYNKRLLTNWKGIEGFAYYDPRFMKYFENENDIDAEFILDRTQPNYDYKGENSPTAFINRIRDLVE